MSHVGTGLASALSGGDNAFSVKKAGGAMQNMVIYIPK